MQKKGSVILRHSFDIKIKADMRSFIGWIAKYDLLDQAIIKEIKALKKLNYSRTTQRSRELNMIQSTWAFKKKRYLDGSLKKYKAKLMRLWRLPY